MKYTQMVSETQNSDRMTLFTVRFFACLEWKWKGNAISPWKCMGDEKLFAPRPFCAAPEAHRSSRCNNGDTPALCLIYKYRNGRRQNNSFLNFLNEVAARLE